MKDSGQKAIQEQTRQRQFRFLKFLIGLRAKSVLRSIHFWNIAVMLIVFGLLYYYLPVAYSDLYYFLFFYPLVYAAAVYRLRGVLVSWLITIAIVFPHALFLAPNQDLMLLMLFSLGGFIVCGMGATLLNYTEHQLDAYSEILALNEALSKNMEQLAKTQKQLIQAEKMNALGQLSSSVAHEINNPLSGILVYARLLTKKATNGTLQQDELLGHLAKIENATSYSSRIVHGLLDFARQTEPFLKPVRIGAVIEQVISLIGYEAEKKHIKVTTEEKTIVPLVTADFSQLQQVFVNLVINAIQATPDGGSLKIDTSVSDDGLVKVSFEDTGSGITPENMDKLFTPFFTTKGAVKGVGLGLSVSYGIIQRHGGRIEVQSEVGKGSTFTVYLPPS